MKTLIYRIQNTFSLIRFSHTIFALPFALASMVVAANGLPDLRTFLLILACMVLARTSAMAFNRYVDADIDAKNPRTKDRHIPSGILSKLYVLGLALICGFGFIAAAYFLNQLAFILSPVALLIIWFYSFTKRFTHASQLFLGLALAISPVGAWIAVTGRFDWPPALLGLAVLFWVAGFDIFYATQDHAYDKEAGLKSLVIKFGIPQSLKMAKIFHALTALFLLNFALFIPSPTIYLIACFIVIAVLIYEHSLVKADDLSRIDQAFFALNGWIGIVYLLGTTASVLRWV